MAGTSPENQHNIAASQEEWKGLPPEEQAREKSSWENQLSNNNKEEESGFLQN